MKKFLFFAAVVVFFILIVTDQMGSFQKKGERRFDALQRPSKEILVGICWPFSVNQDGMADGLQLALDEINSGNLAGGYSFRLVMRDNAFNPEKSLRIAEEFADTPEMSAVIGYYDDDLAVKASQIFEVSRMLHLITGANNTAMTLREFQYIVRTTLSSKNIAHSLAQLCKEHGYRKVALIWEEDAYGEDLAYQFAVGLDNLNIPVVYQWSYWRAHADFRLPVNELKGIDADLIFFAGIEPWAGDFLRNAHNVGLKIPIIGAFSDTPKMRIHAGPGLEGAIYFDNYNVDSQSPENQRFISKFRKRFGKNPDAEAAQGYDALHILAKAVKFTRSRNPLDLSYAIRYMSAWEGANGQYKFDSKGELNDKPIFLEQYRHGNPVLIKAYSPTMLHTVSNQSAK